jgi:hypothetical protein
VIFVGAVVEVIVAECLQSSEHRVDLDLFGDKGGERLLSRVGDLGLQLRAPSWCSASATSMSLMNARTGRRSN